MGRLHWDVQGLNDESIITGRLKEAVGLVTRNMCLSFVEYSAALVEAS